MQFYKVHANHTSNYVHVKSEKQHCFGCTLIVISWLILEKRCLALMCRYFSSLLCKCMQLAVPLSLPSCCYRFQERHKQYVCSVTCLSMYCNFLQQKLLLSYINHCRQLTETLLDGNRTTLPTNNNNRALNSLERMSHLRRKIWVFFLYS